jgi:hypothetical protein
VAAEQWSITEKLCILTNTIVMMVDSRTISFAERIGGPASIQLYGTTGQSYPFVGQLCFASWLLGLIFKGSKSVEVFTFVGVRRIYKSLHLQICDVIYDPGLFLDISHDLGGLSVVMNLEKMLPTMTKSPIPM